ncbi:hypothetical protein OS493_020553 [Desmophyllum pertusum]|uniref:Uncharacterized protein n=1 Tax=Desmophyllum pertusum TaxID=174260 RepID=A0A9W9Z1V0_9CNID|nr:hypothetical protein OS493_020553 [Desmophyllum pertusum]
MRRKASLSSSPRTETPSNAASANKDCHSRPAWACTATPGAATPAWACTATPGAATPAWACTATPGAATPAWDCTATPGAATPVWARTATPGAATPAWARTATPGAALQLTMETIHRAHVHSLPRLKEPTHITRLIKNCKPFCQQAITQQ